MISKPSPNHLIASHWNGMAGYAGGWLGKDLKREGREKGRREMSGLWKEGSLLFLSSNIVLRESKSKGI